MCAWEKYGKNVLALSDFSCFFAFLSFPICFSLKI